LPGFGLSSGRSCSGCRWRKSESWSGWRPGANEGEIVLRLEEVLEAKLEETERKIAEHAAFRRNLLYYRERVEDLKDRVPTDLYCEDVSFCECLEAVTEGGEKL
jgi:hypothetical protein